MQCHTPNDAKWQIAKQPYFFPKPCLEFPTYGKSVSVKYNHVYIVGDDQMRRAEFMFLTTWRFATSSFSG
ncbi:hypothetical protein Ancab_004190 [Ancistrocladus abbreviatus]